MNLEKENYSTKAREDLLRKRIMKKIYTRWLLTRKLPHVLGEVLVIGFLMFMAQSRISFLAVIRNAYVATSGSPVSLVQFFSKAFGHTTPAVRMLAVILAVLAILIVRDVRATRRYNPLSMN